MSNNKTPLLIVVSAPSGAGKTTLCDRLLADRPDIAYSISCTTRTPCGMERDGQDYFFVNDADFECRVATGLFLEHAVVHGFRYGTLRETVTIALEAGSGVLMDIDVQGAAQIRAAARSALPADSIRKGFFDIFISPPSLEVLRQRLENRATDSPETIARRLRNVEAELARKHEFAHVVVNDNLDEAYGEFRSLIERAELDGNRRQGL